MGKTNFQQVKKSGYQGLSCITGVGALREWRHSNTKVLRTAGLEEEAVYFRGALIVTRTVMGLYTEPLPLQSTSTPAIHIVDHYYKVVLSRALKRHAVD